MRIALSSETLSLKMRYQQLRKAPGNKIGAPAAEPHIARKDSKCV